MKTLTKEDVEIELIAHWEDIPVRGNVMASGDDQFDKKCEDEVLERLENGDVWAWANVEVKCSYKGITSDSEYLGGCTYKDEDDFRKGGYFDDMVETCLDNLNEKLRELVNELTD